jgi:hypothetical protein
MTEKEANEKDKRLDKCIRLLGKAWEDYMNRRYEVKNYELSPIWSFSEGIVEVTPEIPIHVKETEKAKRKLCRAGINRSKRALGLANELLANPDLPEKLRKLTKKRKKDVEFFLSYFSKRMPQ